MTGPYEYDMIVNSLPQLKAKYPKLMRGVTRISVVEQSATSRYWVTLDMERESIAGVVCDSFDEFHRLVALLNSQRVQAA